MAVLYIIFRSRLSSGQSVHSKSAIVSKHLFIPQGKSFTFDLWLFGKRDVGAGGESRVENGV